MGEEKVRAKKEVTYNALKITKELKKGKYTWKRNDLVSVTRDGYESMKEKHSGSFEVVKANGLPL
jgi:hypothetical protein